MNLRPFDVFSRIPHHSFPGGTLFRTPLLVLAIGMAAATRPFLRIKRQTT